LSHEAIVSGVEAGVVKRAIEAKLLRLDEVHRLIPASTFARKVRKGRKLSREEADQVARLLRIKGYAAEVFDNADLAESWLSEANPALRERVPADLLLTDEGSRSVETVLRRIDYGDYS
jgi:putative toxin-antitoxin system antitoxin component (TIGR02293 family)